MRRRHGLGQSYDCHHCGYQLLALLLLVWVHCGLGVGLAVAAEVVAVVVVVAAVADAVHHPHGEICFLQTHHQVLETGTYN